MGERTPGPWFYRGGDEWSHSIVTHHGELPDGSPNCWSVADVNQRRDEFKANARLIAAAPELLEALRAVDVLFGHLAKDSTQLSWLDSARAAITKATQGAKHG